MNTTVNPSELLTANKEIKLEYFVRLLNFNFSHLLHIQLEWLEEFVIDLINCLAFSWRNSYYIIRDFTEVGTLVQILHRRGRLSLQRFLTKKHFSLGLIFSNSIIVCFTVQNSKSHLMFSFYAPKLDICYTVLIFWSARTLSIRIYRAPNAKQ